MDNWLAFLESLATEYELPARPRKLFLFQFDRRRKNMTVNEIREELYSMENSGELEESKYDDYRRRLYASFSEACPELMNAKKDKARILWKWLEERYLDWLQTNIPRSLDQIWQELWQSAAEGANVFGLITEKSLDSLGGIGESKQREKHPSEFSRIIKVGQSINLKTKPVSRGKIIILERNQTGDIYCLCPSYLGKENTLNKESLVLLEDFIMLYELDELQLLMVVDPELPSFNWLPISPEKSLQIGCEQLQDIFSRTTLSAKVWRNTYKVIA